MTAPWRLTTAESNRGRARALAMDAMISALRTHGALSPYELTELGGADAPAVGALRLLQESGRVRQLRCGCLALVATWRPDA